MSDKPKIYGTCAAGCLWETVHKTDFLKSASQVMVEEDGWQHHTLEVGKSYKVKKTVDGATEWGFILQVTANYRAFVWNEEAGTLVEQDADKTVTVDLGTPTIYDDYKKIRVCGFELQSYGDASDKKVIFVIELDGVRQEIDSGEKTAIITNNPVTGACVLFNATEVYLLNEDAVVEARDGNSAFVRYSANADGTGFTEEWSEGKNYIGIATGLSAPTDKSGYTWALFAGALVNANVVDSIGDSATAVMSQKASTKCFSSISISEKVGTEPDTTNLWNVGDVEVSQFERVTFALKAGTYTISAFITSTDTDDNKSGIAFAGGGVTIFALLLPRDELTTATITLTADVESIVFSAAKYEYNSTGDTAVFSQISIVDNNATRDVYTAKDDVARKEIADTNSDVVYAQNPNLYDGSWEVGRYNYDTGAKYSGESTHCRNTNPVPLDSNKGYNLVVKTEFQNGEQFYVYRYDEEMNFIDKVSKVATEVIHIEGASFVCFHISGYSTRFPNDPLHVMVFECEDENQSYIEWLEYGEKGSYTKDKFAVSEKSIAKAMLSRDKARFDNSFNYIAYSAMYETSNCSPNTAEHFSWCAKQGYTAIKGDVRPTADGGLIMCHDTGFTFDAEGRITPTFDANNCSLIHNLTTDQCLAYEHRHTLQHPCTLDTFVKICKKHGKIAFITIRDEYIDEVVPALFSILDKYHMRKRCIINSFTFASLKAVREVDDNITLHQVLNRGETISTVAINRAIQLGNCTIGGFSFPNDGRFEAIDKAAVAYAKENDIRLYQGQVDSMDDIDLLMEYGISGAQMLIVPALE